MTEKIPVSVSAELKARVESFVGAVKGCTNSPASATLSSSTVCRMGIEELLERYERQPERVARKLGFSVRARK